MVLAPWQVTVSLPSLRAAAAFCVESGPMHPAPFAVHKPWRHSSPEDLARLAASCPNLPVIAALNSLP